MKKKKAFDVRFPKQRAEQILKYPVFQQEILRLRKKWRLPEIGIKSNKESGQWHAWFYKLNDDYLDSKEYSVKLAPINEFRRNLLTLRKQMRLSDYWDDFIERYLKFNDTYGLIGNNTSLVWQVDENTGERRTFIEFWGHTRREDILDTWSAAKVLQEKMPGYKKTFRDSDPQVLERDFYIYKLHLEGKSAKEITDDVYKHFVKELKDEKKIYDINEDAVRKAIRRTDKIFTDSK